MNIIEAVKVTLEGKRIRRKSWYYMHYIYFDGDDIVFGRYPTEDLQKEREFVFNSRKSLVQHLEDWQVALKIEDYLAEDWEVI